MKLLILGDSHVRRMCRNFTTSSYKLTIKSIAGLQWFNNYNKQLSLLHLLFSSDIQFLLSEADRVLFLISTNSVRIFSASTIISQIEEIIFFLQYTCPQLNRRENIIIPLSFPCLKFTDKFPTKFSLLSNIELYNQRLQQLSFQMKFTTINFHISNHHLAIDKMHVHPHFYPHVLRVIIKHFNSLLKTSSLVVTTTDDLSIKNKPPVYDHMS